MSFISPVATDASGNEKTTGSMQSLGKDDFLQLLVTKLQNQDPLNPTDDQAFISDLAQFSSLEQMNNIADGITQMNNLSYVQSQGLNNMMASGLIGKEVKASFDTVTITSSNKPTLDYQTDAAASSVTLTIKNSAGEVVRTLKATDVAAGSHSVEWDGKDDKGNRVAVGTYTVSASGVTASGTTITPSLTLIGTVSKVLYKDGAAYLVVDGIEVGLSDVSGIGEVGTFSGNN